MTGEQKQIYTRRISEATRTQLITIVYEMARDYMREATEAFSSDEAARDTALARARACIDDLLGALDMRYELSLGLRELYLFARRELILAQTKGDISRITAADRVIEKLHDAWIQIENTQEDGPSFDNAQTVYAGLTYGKGTLNESVADPQANRGFTA